MKHKHHKIITLLLGVSLLGLSGIASAGIVNSLHDFSTGSTTAGNKLDGSGTNATDETCVFCHTPHGASTSAIPLWNRQVPAGASYTTYSSTTMDGGVDLNAGISLACLSCHDGSQAIDNLINMPGTGGYVATTGSNADWGFTKGDTMNATFGITFISTNLGDDHPVGVQYGGGGYVAATGVGGTLTDPDFNTPTFVAASGSAPARWFFDSDGDSRADTNEIRMYTRTVASLANADEPFVECASCHDPHDNSNGTFLRVANTQSAVCTACHVK